MQNKISQILTDAGVLANISSEQIENLIAKYPFASAYRMLKSLKFPNDAENNHNLALMMANGLDLNFNQRSQVTAFEKPDLEHAELITAIDQGQFTNINEIDVSVATPDFAILPDQGVVSKVDDEKEVPSEKLVDQLSGVLSSKVPYDSTDNVPLAITKRKQKPKRFTLNEYSGISPYALWLLSFKKDDIEKKIKKEEKIARKKAFEENARKSITKSSAIISEPLAEILATQGHLDDAKKMYEQLMLKYPEKSSYFAAKINHLIKI